MNTVVLWIGYGFVIVCAVTALLWLWEVTLTKIWTRCVDNADFFKVVMLYAKERKKRRKNNRVAYTDE